jgi:hypothetical protein
MKVTAEVHFCLCFAIALYALSSFGGQTQQPAPRMIFPDNGEVRIGMDLALGGAVAADPILSAAIEPVVQAHPGEELKLKSIVAPPSRGVLDPDTHGLPRFVEVDYVELPKIASISKFRSAVGHDYSDGFESCRSMKHYFKPGEDVTWSGVRLFSPVAGVIVAIEQEWAGTKIEIESTEFPAITFTIFHVKPRQGLHQGEKVAAAQALGSHIGEQTYSDIAVRVNTSRGRKLISYFQVMADPLFAQYRARGLASRDLVIIPKERRDTDPLTCREGQFTSHGHTEDWVALGGVL